MTWNVAIHTRHTNSRPDVTTCKRHEPCFLPAFTWGAPDAARLTSEESRRDRDTAERRRCRGGFQVRLITCHLAPTHWPVILKFLLAPKHTNKMWIHYIRKELHLKNPYPSHLHKLPCCPVRNNRMYFFSCWWSRALLKQATFLLTSRSMNVQGTRF